MKTSACKPLAYLFTFYFLSLLHAQTGNKYTAKDWQLTDLAKDSVYGTSVTKAYDDLLKGKESRPVIVAVIDAGLDTAHEDIIGHVWTNKKEIPGNGIDDDKNGYVDDVHGWNFLGGKDGRNLEQESLEANREYYRLSRMYGDRTDSNAASPDRDYKEWLMLKKQRRQDSTKAVAAVARLTPVLQKFSATDSAWKRILQKDTITTGDIKAFNAKDSSKMDSTARFTVNFFEQRQIPDDVPVGEIRSELSAFIKKQQGVLSNSGTDPNAQRRDIVKDNPDNINDQKYGNNNVAAGTPTHGTHVAGIIGATRNNNLGMNGVADNVLIMPIRAVPDGDERDKDIALAIRYAVDNGARIISMSFGKPYSPGKKWVDDAVKYAEKKDVLLVHAAGNDGKDLDTTESFPTPEFLDNKGKASNYITVGASAGGPDSSLAAPFSNYGAKEVDVFAPGVDVYSTIPGSKYAAFSGTSMATPVVSGVAAMIMEYYPKLSAKQVKYVIENSVSPFPDDVVTNPGGAVKVKFSTLSRTGGVVNAYNALKLAATLKGERK